MEEFAGDFPGGFFWALLPTKMRKNPATKSEKKSGGLKTKSAENPLCQDPTLIFGSLGIRIRIRSCIAATAVHSDLAFGRTQRAPSQRAPRENLNLNKLSKFK